MLRLKKSCIITYNDEVTDSNLGKMGTFFSCSLGRVNFQNDLDHPPRIHRMGLKNVPEKFRSRSIIFPPP